MDKKDVQNLICGGIAGCASRTVVAPLERLKILYQVQDFVQKRNGSSATAIISTQPKYGSVWSSLRRIGVEEGIRGYFRGNGANCARVFPYTAIQFAVFDRMKPLLIAPEEKTIGPVKKLVGGAIAGVVSVIITYPLDYVRARLTVQGGLATTQYTGIWDVIQGTYRTGGITSFYRGMAPTVIGVAPYVGLNFMVFESLKTRVPRNPQGQPKTLHLVVCGAIAGACGQAAAYPMDLLRRRLQLSDLRSSVTRKSYSSIWYGLKTIVREEGMMGMYKGIVSNMIKVVPSIAIMFTTNELLREMLKSIST